MHRCRKPQHPILCASAIVSGTSYYYVQDRLGSVTALISGTGAISTQHAYDPYGNRTTVTETLASDISYAGYFLHAVNGLQFAMYRAYDPTHARWLNRDPIGETGGLNLYAYVGRNPISRRDPLGLWSFKLEGYAGLGGAIIFGQDPTTGNWFYGGRLGIGIGGGSVDPLGKRPGAETGGCGSSTTVGSFGDFGGSVGGLQSPIEQFGGGINLQTGQSYSEGPSLFGTASGGSGGGGIDFGGSFGIEVIGVK